MQIVTASVRNSPPLHPPATLIKTLPTISATAKLQNLCLSQKKKKKKNNYNIPIEILLELYLSVRFKTFI